MAAKKKKSNPPLGPVARAELARLRNIQINQYAAPGDQNLLKLMARRVAGGKKTAAQVEGRVRAGAATRDKLALRAGKTVQAELNPQIGFAKNYEAGVKNLYGQLAGRQAQTVQDMTAQQNQAASGIGARYDALASNIAGEFRQGRESTGDELARLGIAGNMGDTSQAMEQQLGTLAASGKANALTQASASSSATNDLMALLGREEDNTGAGLQAASSQQRGMLEASRAGKVANLWGTLQDQKLQQDAETAQQAFLNKITGAKLNASTDLSNAQALGALATARKNIVDSKRPSAKKVKRIS